MNYVDLIILAIVAISVIFALYRGFIISTLSTVSLGLSGLLSFLCYPLLSRFISGNQSWMSMFVHFTEGSSRVPTMELARASIASLSPGEIAGALEQAAFPYPFDQFLAKNIEGGVYSGQGLTTLADYFDRTLVDVSINCVSFLILLFIFYLIFTLAITLVNAARPMPILRAFDWAAAAGMGVLRGILLVWALFMLVPLVLVILPIDFIQEMFETSSLAAWYYPVDSLFKLIASTA